MVLLKVKDRSFLRSGPSDQGKTSLSSLTGNGIFLVDLYVYIFGPTEGFGIGPVNSQCIDAAQL